MGRHRGCVGEYWHCKSRSLLRRKLDYRDLLCPTHFIPNDPYLFAPVLTQPPSSSESSSPDMVAQFPQELIDIIIDFLHNDKPSLYACSLVCQNWLESSRVHVFSSVMVKDQREFDDCPISIPYIQDLALFLDNIPFSSNFSKCTNLRTLQLYGNTTISNVPFELPSAFPFHRLESLSLIRCFFQDAIHVVNLLFNCPRLNSLHIATVGWVENTRGNSLQEGRRNNFPPLLGELYVQEFFKGGYDKSIIGMIAPLLGRAQFQSIELVSNPPASGSIKDTNVLLKSCGPSLKTLNLASFKINSSSTQTP